MIIKNIIVKFFNLKILLFLAGSSLETQTITVQCKVTESLQQPLRYANILAVPVADNIDVIFAITNQEGNYKS